MTIKGKTKSRTRRVVAAPPRPPVYVRKPPLWRRKWVLATTAAVVVGAILAAVLVAIDNRAEAGLRERTEKAIERFEDQVAAKFPPPPDSQVQPPTGYAIYPTLLSNLDLVAKGSKDVDGVEEGRRVSASAKKAADAISAVQVTRVVPLEAEVGLASGMRGPGTTRLVLIDAQYLIVQAFRMFERVGALTAEAAGATGKDRRALVEEAKQLATLAQEMFARGYGKITAVLSQVKPLQPNPAFPQVPGA